MKKLWQAKTFSFDTSFSSYDLKQEGMQRMIKKHGTDRILFGTDSPWTDAAAEIDFIRNLSLSSSDIDQNTILKMRYLFFRDFLLYMCFYH